MTESLFGPLLSSWQIEQAVISTLRTWLNEYLAEAERKAGLRHKIIPRPPAPESIHGGLDFDTWQQDIGPEVIVVVEPFGEPEREASVGYIQAFQIEVGSRWVGLGSEVAEKPEDEARLVGSYYGDAFQLLVQQGDLEGIATQEDSIVMVGAPRVSAPAPDQKQLVQAVATFHAWAEIVNANEGPIEPDRGEKPTEPEGEWGPEPTAEKVTINLKGELIT